MKNLAKIILLFSIFLTLSANAAEFTINIAQDPGAIMMFGGANPPLGWKVANGESVLRSAYPKLFLAIGTKYGTPVDADHFNLPDMRGIFPKGAGSNSILGSGGSTYSGNLGEYQADQIQGHGHNLSNRVSIETGGLNDNTTGLRAANRYGFIDTAYATTLTDIGYGLPRVGAETRPANVSVTYIIKVDQ